MSNHEEAVWNIHAHIYASDFYEAATAAAQLRES